MIFRFFGFLTFYIFFNFLIFCANAAIFWKEQRQLRSKAKKKKLLFFYLIFMNKEFASVLDFEQNRESGKFQLARWSQAQLVSSSVALLAELVFKFVIVFLSCFVFIFEVILIFEVVLMFEAIFISEVIFIFDNFKIPLW